jgi:hypothetical protein
MRVTQQNQHKSAQRTPQSQSWPSQQFVLQQRSRLQLLWLLDLMPTKQSYISCKCCQDKRQ